MRRTKPAATPKIRTSRPKGLPARALLPGARDAQSILKVFPLILRSSRVGTADNECTQVELRCVGQTVQMLSKLKRLRFHAHLIVYS